MLLFLEINPIAIPETGFFNCTPASIRAIVPEQTVAIEDEPLLSKTSLSYFNLQALYNKF